MGHPRLSRGREKIKLSGSSNCPLEQQSRSLAYALGSRFSGAVFSCAAAWDGASRVTDSCAPRSFIVGLDQDDRIWAR